MSKTRRQSHPLGGHQGVAEETIAKDLWSATLISKLSKISCDFIQVKFKLEPLVKGIVVCINQIKNPKLVLQSNLTHFTNYISPPTISINNVLQRVYTIYCVNKPDKLLIPSPESRPSSARQSERVKRGRYSRLMVQIHSAQVVSTFFSTWTNLLRLEDFLRIIRLKAM